jgi:hypothetical protein
VSAEFAVIWGEPRRSGRDARRLGVEHPTAGRIEVRWQSLFDHLQDHYLLVFTVEPGSESAERLRRLRDATRSSA